MTLHWEDALDRVAAAAAATLRDRDDSDDEGADDQKEGNPEHDAGKQVEGLLLSNITSENDINSFAVFVVNQVDNVFSTRRSSERQNKHIIDWEEGIDSAINSDCTSITSISSAATETVDWGRTLSSTIVIECETILERILVIVDLGFIVALNDIVVSGNLLHSKKQVEHFIGRKISSKYF